MLGSLVPKIPLSKTGRLTLFALLAVTVAVVFCLFHLREINTFMMYRRAHAELAPRLAREGFVWGEPVYLRIFKHEKLLELWLDDGGSYRLFAAYPVCALSGRLGPKRAEGDRQAPEGFYDVAPAAMNPGSAYHLSFDLGYPNAYDRAQGRTGSFLMVHGGCVSIGCFAMTDLAIEDIYFLMQAAFDAGQAEVPVHIFPYRPTPQNIAHPPQHGLAAWRRELQPAYDAFEKTRRVPQVTIVDKKYAVLSSAAPAQAN
jgi:murein L,D-transpeptidase YafK